MDYLELKSDISEASKLISRCWYSEAFSKHCGLYAFTNENLNGYLSKVIIKDKSVLTVATSGDYIFDCYLRGANVVKTFDINKLTLYYIELKQAAIKVLDYNEFISFFCRNIGTNNFNKNIYFKIRRELPEYAMIFWDALFDSFYGFEIRDSNLFIHAEECYDFLRRSVLYFEPDYYEHLQKTLRSKILFSENDFLNSNITNVHLKYDTNFDIVLLSNIADYVEEFYNKKTIIQFKSLIENELSTILEDDGTIFAAYMFYCHYPNQYKIPTINKEKILKKYFNIGYEEWLIDNSHISNTTNDHVLVYKK